MAQLGTVAAAAPCSSYTWTWEFQWALFELNVLIIVALQSEDQLGADAIPYVTTMLYVSLASTAFIDDELGHHSIVNAASFNKIMLKHSSASSHVHRPQQSLTLLLKYLWCTQMDDVEMGAGR